MTNLTDKYKRAVETCGEVPRVRHVSVKVADALGAEWLQGFYYTFNADEQESFEMPDSDTEALICAHVEGWLVGKCDNSLSVNLNRHGWFAQVFRPWSHIANAPTKLDALLKCAEAVKEME